MRQQPQLEEIESLQHVSTAVALTDAQKEKLVTTLSKKIGQPVRLNVEIDPTVLGGVSIRLQMN